MELTSIGISWRDDSEVAAKLLLETVLSRLFDLSGFKVPFVLSQDIVSRLGLAAQTRFEK